MLACPVCGKDLSSCAPRGLTFHARVHGMEPQQLYDVMHGVAPVCLCGCGSSTAWNGWTEGYATLVRGHRTAVLNASVSASLIAGFADGSVQHWTKTHPHAKQISAHAGHKASATLANLYATGRIKHWSASAALPTVRAALSAAQRARSAQPRRWTRAHVEERVAAQLGSNFTIVSGLATSASRNVDHWLQIRCGTCGHVQQRSVYGIVRCRGVVPCWECSSGRSFCSQAEREIGDYIAGLVGDKNTLRQHRIAGVELDLHVPTHGFAVEHNGLYWHSEAIVDRQYHQRKSATAADHGIRLLHIFEDEWRDKRSIVESMISARLAATTKLSARDFDVRELSSEERTTFFNENHVDGDVRAGRTFGLKHGNTIVAAASFRTAMHYDAAELARFATLKFTRVRGAISRLVAAYCASNSGRIITYADQRFGTVHGYESAGFTKIAETGERFWWTDRMHRFDRSFCIASAEDGISELEASTERKLLKVWGCKNSVYELKR